MKTKALASSIVIIMSFITISYNAIAIGFDNTLDSYYKINHPFKSDYQNVEPDPLINGNYIVAGVFKHLNNAIKYIDYLTGKGFNANYGRVDGVDKYYVYLFHAEKWEDAKTEVSRIREDPDLGEAWVMRVENAVGDAPNDHELLAYSGDEEPIAPPILVVENEEIAPIIEVEEEETEEIEEEVKDNLQFNKDEIKGDYYIYPLVVSAVNHQPIEAGIEIVDAKRAKLIKKGVANEVNGVYDPRNGSSTIQLICQKFGYRKKFQEVVLSQPLSDSTRDVISMDGEVIKVNFALDRLGKGDIAVMYNVYFYNDAVIMRPESRYEVNSLLEMLNENQDMKIVIHGHTNGNKPGRIINLNEEETDFFSIGRDNEESMGSAKELSSQRAETIEKYLIDQGIDEKRMSVKGWGGKKMIYDKDSPKAKKNIRVEIEIIED